MSMIIRHNPARARARAILQRLNDLGVTVQLRPDGLYLKGDVDALPKEERDQVVSERLVIRGLLEAEARQIKLVAAAVAVFQRRKLSEDERQRLAEFQLRAQRLAAAHSPHLFALPCEIRRFRE